MTLLAWLLPSAITGATAATSSMDGGFAFLLVLVTNAAAELDRN